MIRNPIDVAAHVSPQLSSLIESRVNDPDAEGPVTLSAVRIFLAGLLPGDFKEAERLHHIDVSDSLLDELNALIAEYGGDVLAVNFSQASASEPLSRVIEAVVNDENRENPPTLATVRDAMASGLLNSLVGDGVLEEDEDDTLLAEIDDLISRFGTDMLAEKLLHYE